MSQGKSAALKLAKRLYPGKRILWSENKKAPGPAEREKIKARLAEIKARREELKGWLSEIDSRVKDGSQLLYAARFVVDVNGDEPSATELKVAVENREHFIQLRDEDADLYRDQRECSGLHARRCEVSYLDNTIPGFPISHQIESADTWAEICEALTRSLAAKGSEVY